MFQFFSRKSKHEYNVFYEKMVEKFNINSIGDFLHLKIVQKIHKNCDLIIGNVNFPGLYLG